MQPRQRLLHVLVRLQALIPVLCMQVQRYLTPKMISKANEAGIELCVIDPMQPLSEQGRFDAIIHKMRPNKGARAMWVRQLAAADKGIMPAR